MASTAIVASCFIAETRYHLKPALKEEVRRLYDLQPTSFEYLFGENVNESLKLGKETYKLSQNLVSTKSRNKVAGISLKTGFKRRPDHEARNKFSSRTQQFLNYQGRKKTHSLKTPQFQKKKTRTENVSRFDYSLPKLKKYLRNRIEAFKGGCISSKIQNITSDKDFLKTVEGLTLDFEQERPSQKTKVMSGQASQNVMVETNKLVGKGVIEYTEHEKESLSHQFSFVPNAMEPVD